MYASEVLVGRTITHKPSEQRYQIVSVGKMKTNGHWVDAARYVPVGYALEVEYYRALDDFADFERYVP